MKKFISAIWLFASTLLFSANNNAAQHYYFNRYTTYDGLPSNTIYNVAQDQFGFIWVSTRDGLCRFDGKRFIEAGLFEQESVQSEESTAICIDSEGFIWFSTKDGVSCYNPMTGDKKSFGNIGDRRPSKIVSDSRGNVWFISNELHRYSKDKDEIKNYPKEDFPAITSMVSDSFGTLWALSMGGILYGYDSRKDSFYKIPSIGIKRMEATSDGKLLICSAFNDVRILDPVTLNDEILIDSQHLSEHRNILCMTERVPGEYWIGTENGVFIYIQGKGITEHIRESSDDKHAISASYIMNMFADKDGNVWAGTFYTGLNLWQSKKDSYQVFYDYKDSNSLKGNIVRPIKQDDEGSLWIGTEDGELNKYDPRTHTMQRFPGKEQFYNIQDVLPWKDDLWIASYGNGLLKYDPQKERIIRKYQLGSEYIIRLFETVDGDILAGTGSGLFKYDGQKDVFEEISSISRHFIHSIFQDHAGNIWIGTLGSGIRVLDSDFKLIAKINASEENGLGSNHITSISEDSKNRIWVTTEGAGVFYSGPDMTVSSVSFNGISKTDGLPSNVTCAIAEDSDGMIWISSTRGLAAFNPETGAIIPSFFEDSQITGNQYTFGSSCIMHNGTVYMGTTDGMVSFSPVVLKSIISKRVLYISEIVAKTSNNSQNLSEPGHSVFTSTVISVKSKNISDLEIHFSSPDYSSILGAQYEYSLSKRRKESSAGVSRTNEGKAVYTNIKPDNYVFNVKMAGCDWEGSSRRLEIKVIPPLYLTAGAKVFYVLSFLCIMFLALNLMSKRREADRRRSLIQLENEKQKEIYDAKIKYFTNITHEIRTPLSLIKMPVDKILASEGYKASAKEDMLTIQANTDRLLELTNQLLDLRKVEQKELKLVFTKEDINRIVIQTCDYFRNIAKERHISLNVNTPDTPVMVMCAAESIKKILSNLISNAIKYGKDRIDVSLTENTLNDTVSIRINSNGPHIDRNDRGRIFEPFFQARMSDDLMQGSNGTGLGLPFARSLAELHSGRLYLDQDCEDFNSFVLEIPVEQPDALIIKEEDNSFESMNPAIDSSRHTLLLVEDSVEMRNYLGKELSAEYNTILTSNGEEAMSVIKDQKVDLVISDIMMPVMDGCELCNRIKTEIDYCHIPVILLTAAVGVETRIKTLKVGADGYIEKPFSIDLLKANIANIFKNKEISFRQFTESPLTHYNGVVVNSIDDDFMERLHTEVMSHLSEQDLNIEALTAILGTSKSTLYRKIKANTGLNINEYIRLCRLKEAAEMLSSQKYRVNEVAYLVGFSSPSYFTTSFQKQFNISPSAFVKHIKQKD